jgi:two-component system chemotaxis response regulator CheB
MMQNPRPIIVTSAFDAATLAQALVIGAMDYVAMGKDLTLIADELIGKVKIAARITPIRRMARSSAQPICAVGPVQDCFKVIAIGVSTGGPSALMDLFSRLPVDFPVAILVAQHMLQGFIEGLIQHLQRRCAFNIEVATPGKVLRPGTALVVPDGCHLRLGIDHRVELVDHQSLPSHYVPSIDIMMQSTAQAFHGKAIGVLLTGMGNDGVIGMQAIKRAGGVTLAQDEATSVVYGMNRMAVELGIVDEVVPITRMADHLVRLCVGQALSV